MTAGEAVELTAEQFTEPFVERLLIVLVAIPSRQAGGVQDEGLHRVLQARIRSAKDQVPLLVSCLVAMRLVSSTDGLLARSSKGDRVCRRIRTDGSHPLAISIIQSGLMATQMRAIRGVLRRDQDGYFCSRAAAQSVAPQLVGLLARMPDVTVGGRIEIGRASGLELDSMWNELTPSSRVDWEEIHKRRKAIGERAELYSMQLERSAQVGARERVVWVSRDDDSLGYDIEVRDQPMRRLEVKGSSGRDVQFFLSSNEYRVAGRHLETYEVHFWGAIDLRADPQEDYDRLVDMGYPIRIANPVVTCAISPWSIEPSQYKVVQL